MQLPGMSTEPVRVSIAVTWWPSDDSWSITRQGWRRNQAGVFELEEMATSGTPLTRSELLLKVAQAFELLETEIMESEDPFSSVGAFR